jgi:hypothetical protein
LAGGAGVEYFILNTAQGERMLYRQCRNDVMGLMRVEFFDSAFVYV